MLRRSFFWDTSLLFEKYGQQIIQTHEATGFPYVADEDELYNPTGPTRYMEACEKFNVTPASFFLRHMQSNELNMMHRGLGPKVR